MTQIAGYWWPDDVGTKWMHALRHVRSIEWAISRCRRRRTAVQAGGNIGLWPKRLAERFARVVTFEPDPVSRACLMRNVPASVIVRSEALGAAAGVCAIDHKSLGSHKVREGTTTPLIALDSLGLEDVDLVQLDIEGYEWHALTGAEQTIRRSKPVIQVELRGFTEQYGQTDRAVRDLLLSWGYQHVSDQPGSDAVFAA